jgi:hypothetical protein
MALRQESSEARLAALLAGYDDREILPFIRDRAHDPSATDRICRNPIPCISARDERRDPFRDQADHKGCVGLFEKASRSQANPVALWRRAHALRSPPRQTELWPSKSFALNSPLCGETKNA